MFIKYTSTNEWVQIYEMTDDLTEERCVYSSNSATLDDWNDIHNEDFISLGHDNSYQIDVLTTAEYFLEML